MLSASVRFSVRSGVLALALAPFVGSAHAATVAVAGPINNQVDPKLVFGAHQLMASELDFQDGIDGVKDLEEPPASLNNACLASVACLKGIAAEAGSQWVVTGSMAAAGSQVALDLLLFDGSTIVRRKTWMVENDATALANSMTPIIRELLTGQGPAGGGGATGGAAASASFSDDDELDFKEGGGGGAAGGAAAGAAAGRTGDPEVDGLMDIDSLDDLDDPKERQAAAAAVVAAPAAVAAVPAAVAPAAAAAASEATGGAMSDEDVLAMISFGGGGGSAPPATNPVQTAATNYANQGVNAAQGAANTAINNAVNSVPSTGNAAADAAIGGAAAAAANAAKNLIDLEGEKATKVAREGTEHVNITLRGGYSTYYKFKFVTGGGEVGVPLGSLPLNVVAGVEMYNVQRTLPPEIQVQTGQIFEWNQIFPMNLGMLYRLDLGGMARPYFGADGIMVQYYRDEVGGDWAGGARARAGVDIFPTQYLGVNVNAAVGGWLGQNWPLIEPGVGKSGLLPQVSAGVVAAF